jgi:hypothetical protein
MNHFMAASRILHAHRPIVTRRHCHRTVRIKDDSADNLFHRTTMTGTTLTFRWNWQTLFSYGEVVCFVSAWAIGLLLALDGQRAEHERTATQSFAATSDSLGIQARLGR